MLVDSIKGKVPIYKQPREQVQGKAPYIQVNVQVQADLQANVNDL